MKTVNLKFSFRISQFITQVKHLTFEGYDVDLTKYASFSSPFTYSGEIKDLSVIGDLEIFVSCRGNTGQRWTLEVEVDGKKLTTKPISGITNERMVSSYNVSHKLPV